MPNPTQVHVSVKGRKIVAKDKESPSIKEIPPEIRSAFEKALGRAPGRNYGKGPDPRELFKAIKASIIFSCKGASGGADADASGGAADRADPPPQDCRPIAPQSSPSSRMLLFAVGVLMFVGLLYLVFR